ncbi:MAG: beta-lactamase family protein [Nocardiopsaceae bacterium]|nr:beta-lactamase family protein [Nocardiopsaceae bacterium]
MSDQPESAAHRPRDLPDRPSLRHSKLEAKRRLAAGEFATLHDAQLAVAREHGMSSWAALKGHIAAAEAANGHALAQVRWVFGRYGAAGEAGWTAPNRDELSEHFTERLLTRVPPQTMAAILAGIAPRLHEDLVVLDADSLRLHAKVADLVVRAAVEPEAPHRLDALQVVPGGAPATDTRVARPPSASAGPVPGQVPGLIEDSYTDLGLVGLTAAGDTGSGSVPEVWACSRGWADLEQNLPLSPGHRFPAYTITTLVTATAVLCLVADGAIALDDPVNARLRSLRLADDAVTVRDLLSHTGGVDSPPPAPAEEVADVAAVLGPVAACSGPRGVFAFSHAGYTVLGQLIADLTGTPFARAATRLVLEPLGMADSWFPERAPAEPDAPRGYRLKEDGTFEPEQLPVAPFQGASGLWSTAPDLVRFGAGWRTLLPADLATEAQRPQAQQYDSEAEIGLGWLLRRPLDRAGHAGSGPSSSVSLITSLDTDRTSVVLTNRQVPVEPMNARLIRLVFEEITSRGGRGAGR